jgi:hypothetical protein
MYSFTIRNRASAVLFSVLILGIGAIFLTVGFALLLALVVAAGVLGAGVAVYRMFRGGRASFRQDLYGRSQGTHAGLDPTLEVQPVRAAIVRPRGETNAGDAGN